MNVYKWEQLQNSELSFDKGTGISIGSFDGLHLGHRMLLGELVKNCSKQNLIPGVLSFTRPLPSIKHHGDYKGDISTLKQRLNLFEKLGIEFVILVDFTEEFSKLSGKDFLDILKNKCSLKLLAEGIDFRCGYKGATDTQAIKYWAQENSIETVFVEPVYYRPGTDEEERISSSYIRNMILKGFFTTVEQMLSRPYEIDISDLPFTQCKNRKDMECDVSNINQVLPPSGIFHQGELRLEFTDKKLFIRK